MDDMKELFDRIFTVLPKEDFLQKPELIVTYMKDVGFEKPIVNMISSVINLERRRFILSINCDINDINDIVSVISNNCLFNMDVLKRTVFSIRQAINDVDKRSNQKNAPNYDGTGIFTLDLSELIHVDRNARSYTIPDSIIRIQRGALRGCKHLETIIIPDSIIEICDYAFENCSSLKEIILPDSIRTIGYGAFSNCTSLKTIKIPDSVIVIESNLFSNCSSLERIQLPESITTIEYGAFEDCSSLKEIILPDSIRTIGYGAFSNCSSLERIQLPESITTIEYGAFKGCINAQIHIGKTDVSSNGMYKIVHNSLLSLDDEDEEGYSIVTGYGLVKDGKCLIPDSVRWIDSCAFYNCADLVEIEIPDGAIGIERSTFESCKSLRTVIIPDSVCQIEESAFQDCESLEKISMPDSID